MLRSNEPSDFLPELKRLLFGALICPAPELKRLDAAFVIHRIHEKDTTNIPPDSQQHVELIGAHMLKSSEETKSRNVQAI